MFNQFGDLERCSLRPGNVHSADGWRDVLEPVVARYRGGAIKRRFFRGDAAFALPDLYDFLEAEGYNYAIRLKAMPAMPPFRWLRLRCHATCSVVFLPTSRICVVEHRPHADRKF